MKKFYIAGQETNDAVCGIGSQNFYKIKNSLVDNGWTMVENFREADAIICCFCAFTSDDIKDNINSLKMYKNETGKIYITGCMASIKEVIEPLRKEIKFEEFKTIDALIQKLTGTETTSYIEVIGGQATITFADGCNPKKSGWCSFCKQWYMKRPLECKPIKQVVHEIEIATSKGATWITLHAMNATQYKDPITGEGLLELLQACVAVEGPIFQLNALVAAEMTDELGEFIKKCDRIAIIGLETQSFIPKVRKKMNVGDDNARALKKWLQAFSNKAIISDLIVGHPGENNANFEEQKNFIKKSGYYFLIVNPLIINIGTPVAKMEYVDNSITYRRLSDLIFVIDEMRKKQFESIKGKEIEAIVIKKLQQERTMVCLYKSIYIIVKEGYRDDIKVGDKITVVCKSVLVYRNSAQFMEVSDEEEVTKNAQQQENQEEMKATLKSIDSALEFAPANLVPELQAIKDSVNRGADSPEKNMELLENLMLKMFMNVKHFPAETSGKKTKPHTAISLAEFVNEQINR